jgi:hypothetical protein
MIIKKKCRLLIFAFLQILINNLFNCQSEENKNILEREKDVEDDYDPRKNTKYTIHSQISKFYNNSTEVFISMIDLRIGNKISFGEDFKESYFNSYENLLAPTQKFFPLSDFDKLNSTQAEISSNKNDSFVFSQKNKTEIFVHSIIDSFALKAKFLFLRNVFYNLLDFDFTDNNCNKNLLRKFNSEIKFYDANLLIVTKDYFKNCLQGRNTKNGFFYDKENDMIFVNRDINFLEESDNILLYDFLTKENQKIYTKITRKRILEETLKILLENEVKICILSSSFRYPM